MFESLKSIYEDRTYGRCSHSVQPEQDTYPECGQSQSCNYYSCDDTFAMDYYSASARGKCSQGCNQTRINDYFCGQKYEWYVPGIYKEVSYFDDCIYMPTYYVNRFMYKRPYPSDLHTKTYCNDGIGSVDYTFRVHNHIDSGYVCARQNVEPSYCYTIGPTNGCGDHTYKVQLNLNLIY